MAHPGYDVVLKIYGTTTAQMGGIGATRCLLKRSKINPYYSIQSYGRMVLQWPADMIAVSLFA